MTAGEFDRAAIRATKPPMAALHALVGEALGRHSKIGIYWEPASGFCHSASGSVDTLGGSPRMAFMVRQLALARALRPSSTPATGFHWTKRVGNTGIPAGRQEKETR